MLDYRRWAHAQKQGTRRRMQVHRPINRHYSVCVLGEVHKPLVSCVYAGSQFPTCKVVFHKDMIECVMVVCGRG
ncbi:hypothetical protein TRIATDRAFT_255878 [Trichoderma atroviride IMI 206040]|uniref:Uncharacterized protein n=1 Tax=Hypocrea atroviridis (strain ATCC 20476 / IMI 206040) TaxID=452589 RepID=G9NPD5_HYPAI|nr:uncharacterized protein TRIATDRAFT_255878 [Trichoderma atroviride IMI 206040]EHK47406.1 hypothetical protein TRIATDRAFT_255878 [Trichoderma atroviride IMI 206040]